MNRLSNEEQLELVQASQKGDMEAFSKLTQEMLPYVEYVIRKVLTGYEEHNVDTSNLSHEDLRQAGLLGLIGSVNGYKPDKGAAFASYAYYGIEGAVKGQISFELNHSGIKDSGKIVTTLSMDDETTSLEEKENLFYDESDALYEIFSSEDRQEQKEKFQKAIDSLDEKEKKILFMINGIDTEKTSNHKKIAKELGISEIDVKKAIKRASKKMADAMGE